MTLEEYLGDWVKVIDITELSKVLIFFFLIKFLS